MIPVTTFDGRKVALFGLGGSGLATARALKAGGADVVCFDDNEARVAQAAGEGLQRKIFGTSTGRTLPHWFLLPVYH